MCLGAFGYWLYQNKTINKPEPSPQASVSFSSPSSEFIEESNESTSQTKDTEKQMGYIQKVYQKNGENYIDIDYIQYLGGEEGSKACVEDGNCVESCLQINRCLPNGYYIRNQNDKIRTFIVVKDATIFLLDFSTEEQYKKISFGNLMNTFNSSEKELLWFKQAPYSIELEEGIVTSILQRYIP